MSKIDWREIISAIICWPTFFICNEQENCLDPNLKNDRDLCDISSQSLTPRHDRLLQEVCDPLLETLLEPIEGIQSENLKNELIRDNSLFFFVFVFFFPLKRHKSSFQSVNQTFRHLTLTTCTIKLIGLYKETINNNRNFNCIRTKLQCMLLQRIETQREVKKSKSLKMEIEAGSIHPAGT